MMSTTRQAVLSVALVVVAAGAVGAYALYGDGGPGPQEGGGHAHGAGPAAGGEAQPVHLDSVREGRIGVTYATAERKALDRTVRTVASVTYDETRVVAVSPRIRGWVERIHVDFLGSPVRRGEPLVELYSPELVSAQEELLLARGLLDATRDAPGSQAHENAERLLASARQRLEYWDIPADQVAMLEESGTPQRTLLLRAPASGVVVEKNTFEGAYVSPGSTLYVIADLARVWVEGEVFEKDLSLLRVGQAAAVHIDAYPGETFQGRVSYVYPTVSVASRTGRVRVEMENGDGRLKPGMYAEIRLDAPVGRTAVVVPRTAVVTTGERDIVFVRMPDGMLAPRAVTLGLPAGQEVEILAGLEPGEVVVASATFLIDAESNLGAAMSQMGGMQMGPGSDMESGGAQGPGPAPKDTARTGGHEGHGAPPPSHGSGH